ncbi:MAG: ABC transporter ATP-binding protein [Gammaproteobacteria bacterium]|nr:ABC transporter ATP-binding protein [Gammaproteobacteria bacterium]
MSKVLVASNISKHYSDGDVNLTVLHDLDFSVGAGERVSLVGRSGAGKSTLLHILAGLTEPSSGEVVIGDRNMTSATPSNRAAIRRDLMGFVYQYHHLLPDFTALENVVIPQLISQEKVSNAERRATELLTSVGLADRLNHRPAQLSGGERQRVALSRALATKPLLVLADEPTGNLDKANEKLVLELMKDLSEQHGAAFVTVTHNEDLALQSDRLLYLDDGCLSQHAD